MTWMLLATGFTGALTLVFLVRLAHRSLADAPHLECYFSPKGGCTDAIVRELKRAQQEILVLAHRFAYKPLADALLDAKMRGVSVEVILDGANQEDTTSDLHLFAEQGLAPLADTHFPVAHNSVILIDKRRLITGSFDFTQQAEEGNAENLLIVGGYPDILGAYRKTFLDLKTKAKMYRTDATAPEAPVPASLETEEGAKVVVIPSR